MEMRQSISPYQCTKEDQAALREAHLRLSEAIVATVREPMFSLDGQLRVVSANRVFIRTFHVSPEDTVGRLLYDLGNHQWDRPALPFPCVEHH